MKELFTSIVNVQLGASIAIGLLLMSHSLLKRRYVAKLRYWLWLVVAVRLLVPVDINIQLDRQAPVAIPVQEYYVSVQQPEYEGEATQFEIITAQQLNLQSDTVEDAVQQTQQIKNISVTDMLYRFWLMVAVGLLGVSFLSYRLAKRDILSTAVYDENLSRYMNKVKGDMGIDTPVRLAVCSYTGSPMLMGIIKPVIVLPDTQYTQTELEMILRHELTHLRRRDILYKMMLHIVACVYWFNPLMYFMSKYAGQDIEFSCDEDTVKQKGKEFKAEYARTIVKVITMQNNRLILATTFSQNAQTVKERFTNIFFGRRLKKGRNILAGFMAVVVMVTTMVGCGTGKNGISGKILPDINLNSAISGGSDARIVSAAYVSFDGFADNIHPVVADEWYFNYITDDDKHFSAKIDLNAEMSFMCNKTDCLHTDESCLAYMPSDMFLNYFTANNQLYAYDSYVHPENTDDKIYRISELGREVVCNINGYELGSKLVCGDILYIGSYNKESKVRGIYYVNLATGEHGDLYRFEKDAIVGGYFNLVDISADGRKIYMELEQEMTRSILSVNLETGEISTIRSIDYNDIWSGDGYWCQDYVIEDNIIYTVNLKTDTLVSQSLSDNTATTLITGLSEKLGNAPNASCVGVYDGKLILDIIKDNGKKYGQPRPYAIDLKTLEVMPLTEMVGRQSGNILSRCNIYGEMGNCFIISTSFDGEIIANMGIISKTDYFSNNPQILPLGKVRLY